MVTPCAFSHGCARLAMISVASFVEADVIFSPAATRASSDWPLATAIQPARKAAPPLPLVYSTFIAEAGSNPSSLTRRFARPEMPSNSPLAMFPTNTSSNRTPSRPASSIAAREASASRPTTFLSLLPNFVVAQPTIATDRIPAGKAFRLHKCREMVWIDAESFGLTRDKLNRRPVFSGPLTRKEPVEPQGGIEPPICALPRRRYTPKPLRQRRRPKGGRYLGLSTAIG